MARVASITSSEFYLVGKAGGSRTVTVGRTRGKIYDRNLNLIVDEEEKLIAVITPAVGSLQYLDVMKEKDFINNMI